MKDAQTDIQKQRSAWFAEHLKPGMSSDGAIRLSEELIRLFPMTLEEREQRAKEMVGEEFVL